MLSRPDFPNRIAIAAFITVAAALSMSCVTTTASRAMTGMARPDTAEFILRSGADTGAIDRVIRTGNHVVGSALVARTMNVQYALESAEGGEVISFAFRLGSSASVVTDSIAFAPVQPGGASTVVTRGRMPLWTSAPGLYDVLVRRAWSAASGGGKRKLVKSPVGIPLFRFGAASPVDTAFVEFLTVDSARITFQTDGAPSTVMALRFGADGRLVRAVALHDGWVIERAPVSSASAYAPSSSYGAPPGAPYTAEPVTIDVGGGVALSGTLTRPTNAGRVPAVVLLHGSSPSDRNNSRPPIPGLFWQLADTLGRRGIAVLRYDQRGIGESKGSSDSATIQVRAADAAAALTFLRTQSGIDSTRLALIGLSEGAMVAPIVASMSGHSLRGLVLLSSPARSGRELSAHQTRVAVDRYLKLRGGERDSAMAKARAEDDALLKMGRGHDAALLAYDPLPAARGVKVPVLIVHGETDTQVPSEDAYRLAAEITSAGNSDVTVRVLANLNHILLFDRNGDWRRYLAVPSLLAPSAARGLIADWVVSRMGSGPHFTP